METSLGNAQHLKPPKPEAAGPDLYDRYGATFRTVRVQTTEQQQASFRLRYEVYCVENHFLRIEDNPGGLETDNYEGQSLHTLLVHRASEAIVGTVRLVTPVETSARAPLPLYEVCPEAMAKVPLHRTAEISRLAVSKSFRRRKGDDLYGRFLTRAELEGDARRFLPHLMLGLLQAVVEMASETGMDHICAIMDPALLRLLARFGIHFTMIGKPIEYHGLRQPCYSDLGKLLAHVERTRFDVWEILTDRGNFWPAQTIPTDAHDAAA